MGDLLGQLLGERGLTPFVRDLVAEWCQEYGPPEVVAALEIALKANVRKPNYVEAILRNRRAGVEKPPRRNRRWDGSGNNGPAVQMMR